MQVTCAVSGIKFSVPSLDFLSIPATTGYYHPVFTIDNTSLYKCYYLHCKGKLSVKDSYLTFLAFLHSSDKIKWNSPVSLDPAASISLVNTNIDRLVRVLEKTDVIKHPSFIQPEFSVTYENSNLEQISGWIGAWEDNIKYFYNNMASRREQEDLQAIENKLSKAILSGNKPEQYAATLATWADRTAVFPAAKAEAWKTIIRTCFSPTKMFSTNIAELKEVTEYCQLNIEAGSIHFHELCKALETGKKNNIGYLGMDSIDSSFELLLPAVAAPALTSPPIEADYTSKLDYIRAKLAYRIGKNSKNKNTLNTLNIKENVIL